MYVNELTCDYGDEGRQAVRELLRRAEASGVERARSRRVRLARESRGHPFRRPDADRAATAARSPAMRPDDLAATVDRRGGRAGRRPAGEIEDV